MSKLQYIFVHGLSGWGSYDARYSKMPYWGMRGGDLMAWLRTRGFDCCAASVAPAGSAWDRACELYAQLAGTRVDYGEAHSRKCGHERYGKDFSACPLIPSWDENTRLVLLGHSFGGATVRILSELLAHGDAEEQACADPSPLFLGGMEERVHSIVALAAPMNGTTAYDLFLDPSFRPESVRVPWWSKKLASLMSKGTRPKTDDRAAFDYAGHDMHIDNAIALNERITTLSGVFYYSVPFCATKGREDGTQIPMKGMEPLFVMRSYQIGAYSGKTSGGRRIDESWRRNDGLVNTVSAMYPSGAPHTSLDRKHILPGIWNVFPEIDGDHMWPQGGLMHKHDVRGFYLDLLNMIDQSATRGHTGD